MRIPTILILTMLILSCSKVRVSTLSSNHRTTANDSINISYNFWRQNGMVQVTILNSSSKPLYVDWKKSTLFINKGYRPYWQDKEIISSAGMAYIKYGIMGSVSSSILYRPERIGFIAPKSSLIFVHYELPDFQMMLKNETIENKIRRRTFEYEQSPLYIRNFLTLSTKETFESEIYIDDTWFVSQIMTMKRKEFRGAIKKSSDESLSYVYPYTSDSAYYYKYIGR